jgi:hypothetical protein
MTTVEWAAQRGYTVTQDDPPRGLWRATGPRGFTAGPVSLSKLKRAIWEACESAWTTESQPLVREPSRSVRAVRGGLPTLGRGHR